MTKITLNILLAYKTLEAFIFVDKTDLINMSPTKNMHSEMVE